MDRSCLITYKIQDVGAGCSTECKHVDRRKGCPHDDRMGPAFSYYTFILFQRGVIVISVDPDRTGFNIKEEHLLFLTAYRLYDHRIIKLGGASSGKEHQTGGVPAWFIDIGIYIHNLAHIRDDIIYPEEFKIF